MKTRFSVLALTIAAVALTTPTVASAQTWANWSLPTTCGGSVSGGLATYTGTYNAVQNSSGNVACGTIGSGGSNFWLPAAHYSPTPNNISIIQLIQAGGPNTITFNQAVIDPYIAMVSIGQPSQLHWVTYLFSNAFSVISHNTVTPAFWGTGSYSTPDAMTLVGKEFSGVLQFSGAYAAGQSLTFTVSNNEDWHGFTVGATSVVPEPSTSALMSVGLIGMGFAARRRRRV